MAGASSSARGSVVESKVEMDVRFELEQGKHTVVKYRTEIHEPVNENPAATIYIETKQEIINEQNADTNEDRDQVRTHRG